MKLSKLAKTLKPSATLAITAKAKELKSQGIDVIGFGAEIGRASCRERV